MEMRYFYAYDQVNKSYFSITWHPGAEILADYPSKHHDSNIIRKWAHFSYSKRIHRLSSLRSLARKPFVLYGKPRSSPSVLQGCVAITSTKYVHT